VIEVYLGSSEVILKGAKVPGPHQSSATRPKRSVESGNGRLTYLAETKRGSRSSSVHSGHIVDNVLVAGEVKGSFLPNVLSGCT
jgi:hypothetical protein